MKKTQKIIIDNAITYIQDIFKDDYSGHDFHHTYRVYRLAIKIAKKEKADLFICSLSSLLHDVDDRKLTNDTSENLPNATLFLKNNNISKENIERIKHIILQVSFKGKDSLKPDSIEGCIVQDADRLDAIGAIGIARTFTYGGNKNRTLYDPNIQPNIHLSKEEYYKSNSTTINHFYEKLLLLKEMMNTKYAKELAIQRHKFMEKFLKEFFKEWNI